MAPTFASFTGGFLQTNAWLLQQDERLIVGDAPEGTCDWLVENRLQPQALLLTHLHFDHVMDAAKIARRFKCPIYAHSALNTELTLEKHFGVMTGTSFAVEPFAVTHLLAGQAQAEVAGFSLTLLELPGHSPDSLGFYLPEAAAVISGDTLFAGGVGRFDFPGGDWPSLEKSIREQLYTLPASTRVLPGHGAETTVEQEKGSNPYVRPML